MQVGVSSDDIRESSGLAIADNIAFTEFGCLFFFIHEL
jgi:hypothetical protein